MKPPSIPSAWDPRWIGRFLSGAIPAAPSALQHPEEKSMKFRIVHEPWHGLYAVQQARMVDGEEFWDLVHYLGTEEAARQYAELYAAGGIVVAELELPPPGGKE